MLFMPSQAATTQASTNGTHRYAAFCSHSSPPPGFVDCCDDPPKKPAVMARGTANCMAETPRLPRPALRPRAVPFRAFGKKKLMLAMLEAKFPPPSPAVAAIASSPG